MSSSVSARRCGPSDCSWHYLASVAGTPPGWRYAASGARSRSGWRQAASRASAPGGRTGSASNRADDVVAHHGVGATTGWARVTLVVCANNSGRPGAATRHAREQGWREGERKSGAGGPGPGSGFRSPEPGPDAPHTRDRASRQAVPGGGDFSGAPVAFVRRAMRAAHTLSFSSRLSERSARRARSELRDAPCARTPQVRRRVQRPTRRCEPPPGTACRDARQRQGSPRGTARPSVRLS